MFCRQMKKSHLCAFQQYIQMHAKSNPLCPIYELDITVDRVRYSLFIQFDRHHRAYALYALQYQCGSSPDEATCSIVTDTLFLSALTEIILHYSLRDFPPETNAA